MDVTATTPRLSAYFAFGVQWASTSKTAPPENRGEASTRAAASATSQRDATANTSTNTTANTNTSASGAIASRVIDVQARRVDPDAASRKAPAHRQGNIFLSQPPVTTYAPPARTGQPVRLVQSVPAAGQNLDTWA